MHSIWLVGFLGLLLADLATALACYSCQATEDFPQKCSYLQNGTRSIMNCPPLTRYCHTKLSPRGPLIQLVESRGCQDLAEPQCDRNNAEHCFLCDEMLCNRDQHIVEKCVGLHETVTCPYATVEVAGCASWNSRTLIKRNCLSLLPEQKQLSCLTGEDCEVCYGDLCNRNAPQKCYTCETTVGDSCIKTLDNSMVQTCSHPVDKCYISRDAQFNIVRGCLRDSNSTCEGPLCMTCDTSLCNDKLFNVVKDCYNCSSLVPSQNCDLDQALVPSNKVFCKNVLENNYCYTFYHERFNKTFRGCLLDGGEFATNCLNSPESCQKCQSSLCNSVATYGSPAMACVQCDETDAQCPINMLADPRYMMCSEQSLFFRREGCFKHTFPDGRIRYGCLNDDPEFCKSHDCQTCFSAMCNFVAFVNQKCVQCNSTGHIHCANRPDLIKGVVCKDPNNFGNLGCFAFKDNHDITYRGCTNELSYTRARDCMFSNSLSCQLCNGENCNKHLKLPEPIKDAAIRMALNAIVISIVVIMGFLALIL